MRERLLSDADEPWAVYADRLCEAGDPRGPLVAEQPRPTLHRELPEAQRAHIAAHGLLGPIERPERHRLTWHRGHWRHVGSWTHQMPDAFWEALFAHPCAEWLRELSLRWMDPPQLLATLQRYRPPIQRLHWNERDEGVALDPFLAAMPELEHLSLWRPGRLTSAPVRRLRTLHVNAGPCPQLHEDLAALGRGGAFDALEDLEVWGSRQVDPLWAFTLLERARPRRLAFAGSIDGRVVEPLLRSPAFADLRELELTGFWPEHHEVEALVRAIESRGTLERYHSSGWEPPPELQARLRAAVTTVSATL